MKQFRFFLFLNDDDTELTPVNPNYKDDIALETELENNQRFYRDKLSGKISFLNKPTKDFDFIMSQPFDTQYNFLMQITYDYGQTWENEYLGKFFRTDCEINYDDKKIDVQPDALDDYTEVLAGLDKEYNLADLGIEVQGIHLDKRPLIQVYIPGDEIVSCFLSGMYWEQDVRESTEDLTKLTQQYKFSYTTVIRSMYIKIDGPLSDITGTYTAKTTNINPFLGTLYGSTGYRILINTQSGNITRVYIIRNSDNVIMYRAIILLTNGLVNMDFFFLPVAPEAYGQPWGYFRTKPIYMRYLLDKPQINGVNTYVISDEDIVDNNRNYRYCIGYAVDLTVISNNFSNTPTKWGKNSAGQYFLPPYSIFGQKYYPIARSQWDNSSYWFAFHSFDELLEYRGRNPTFLKDSYPIHSVISELLKEFSPKITHEGTEEYSKFLYGDINPISGLSFRVFMSQKTNVLNIQYQNPAQKTEMSLQWVLNMLRDCFRCFWYIEDNKLKIEHVLWFKNGGNYVNDPVISYDITQMINVRNGKDWGFNTSTITYDKVDMPERFEFNWMDDVSNYFQGEPIQVLSRYVMPGKKEEINVSNFTSDIDYLLLNPSEISQDGFALMAAVERNGFRPLGYGDYSFSANNGGSNLFEIKESFRGANAQIKLQANTISGSGISYIIFTDSSGTAIPGPAYTFIPDGTDQTINVEVPTNAVRIGVYSERNIQGQFNKFTVFGEFELPYITHNDNGTDISLQNGILAFSELQPNFYVYDLPAKRVKINDEETFVQVERKKKQPLDFPIKEKINPLNLVNTHIGLGQIDKVSLNLHSRMTKTTLKYDTE